MILDVDTASPVPAYEQVRSQLAGLIASGQLPVGHRLPTIRQLSADLGLAPGTVARVYRELETEGFVSSRVRHGTVVQAAPAEAASVVRDQAEDAARTYAATARRLGLTLDDAVAAVRARWPDGGAPDDFVGVGVTR